MDIDPLADTVPPRHAIESDEEEDEINPLRVTQSDVVDLDIKIIGQSPTGRNLVVAAGDAGKYWARGARLGEQSGAVSVNGVQVGLVFSPSYTQATIIVSEVTTRLPVWAMHKYAQAVLDHFGPSSLSLLDLYPVHTYISAQPTSIYDAPLRYLATSAPASPIATKAEPFSPPNLIQSTSAAFLSIISTVHQANGTLILLPSPHVPPPPPRTITPSNFSHFSEDQQTWSRDTISTAHTLLFHAIGETTVADWQRHGEDGGPSQSNASMKRSVVGEGGMYI